MWALWAREALRPLRRSLHRARLPHRPPQTGWPRDWIGLGWLGGRVFSSWWHFLISGPRHHENQIPRNGPAYVIKCFATERGMAPADRLAPASYFGFRYLRRSSFQTPLFDSIPLFANSSAQPPLIPRPNWKNCSGSGPGLMPFLCLLIPAPSPPTTRKGNASPPRGRRSRHGTRAGEGGDQADEVGKRGDGVGRRVRKA